MEFESARDVDFSNKTVVMRVDYNLPLDEEGRITDHTRISLTLKTLNYILNKGGKIVLVAHLGRPNNREKKLRMDVIADRLTKLIGKKVKKLDGCIEESVKQEIKKASSL